MSHPKMHIASVICENGLGHFKRSIGLLYAIIEKYPHCKIDIVCTQQQITLTEDWSKTALLLSKPAITFHTNVISPGVHWTNNPSDYNDDRLIKWIERLRPLAFLKNAKLVICDNMAGILMIRPDAILMGSFLWFDILENSYPNISSVQSFIKRNKALLLKTKPPMLCVEAIAMPALNKYTNAIGLPWFAQDKRQIAPSSGLKKKVAILTGASKVANQLTLSILNHLTSNDIQFLIPQRIIDLLEQDQKEKLRPFNFTLEEFESCDFVICRPGVGTVTDCITTNTPMLVFHEGSNTEMQTISENLVALGIAQSIGSNPSSEILLDTFEKMYTTEVLESMSKKMQTIPVNGFEMAISWLENNNYLTQATLN